VPPFPVGNAALPVGLKTRGYVASLTLRSLWSKPAAATLRRAEHARLVIP
jgi:hypothetical protein